MKSKNNLFILFSYDHFSRSKHGSVNLLTLTLLIISNASLRCELTKIECSPIRVPQPPQFRIDQLTLIFIEQNFFRAGTVATERSDRCSSFSDNSTEQAIARNSVKNGLGSKLWSTTGDMSRDCGMKSPEENLESIKSSKAMRGDTRFHPAVRVVLIPTRDGEFSYVGFFSSLTVELYLDYKYSNDLGSFFKINDYIRIHICWIGERSLVGREGILHIQV